MIDLEANPDKGYLFEQADNSWKTGKYATVTKYDKVGTQFNQFSDDSLFRAYRKRTRKMHEKMQAQSGVVDGE